MVTIVDNNFRKANKLTVEEYCVLYEVVKNANFYNDTNTSYLDRAYTKWLLSMSNDDIDNALETLMLRGLIIIHSDGKHTSYEISGPEIWMPIFMAMGKEGVK